MVFSAMVFMRLRGHWQPLVDVALAAATALLFLLSDTIIVGPLAAAQLLPLVWRRRFPATVLIIVGCATAAHTSLGMARAVGFFPATIALYTAATYRSPAIRWLLCPAVGIAMAAASAYRHGPVEGLLMAIVTVAVAWLAGVERSEHLRQRAEADRQAARLRLERRLAEHQTVAAEDRERLARRVHDTLARTVTVMLLQTEAIKATATLDPAGAQRLDVVLHAGREALSEVRAALELATADEDDSGSLLATRLDLLGTAGLRLAAPPPDLHRLLPAPLRSVGDRLIAEAATNALRHDGPGTLLTISTTAGADTLTLHITSRPRTPAAGPAHRSTGGFGLLSLAEDLSRYGGTLTYGPMPSSGWQTTAAFPLFR